MNNSRPAWWLLYALLPLGAALLVAADLASPSAGWRIFAECTASLLILGAIALWVHANRAALAVADHTADGSKTLHSSPEYSLRPKPLRLQGIPRIEPSGDSRAQARLTQ